MFFENINRMLWGLEKNKVGFEGMTHFDSLTKQHRMSDAAQGAKQESRW